MSSERDRRQHKRLNLALPIQVRAQDNTGTLFETTFTSNISAGGLYLETSRWHDPEVDQVVDVSIGVPPVVSDMMPMAKITTSARVARVDEISRAEDADRAARRRQGTALVFCDRLRYSYFDLPSF